MLEAMAYSCGIEFTTMGRLGRFYHNPGPAAAAATKGEAGNAPGGGA
jgi:hypothetical protein